MECNTGDSMEKAVSIWEHQGCAVRMPTEITVYSIQVLCNETWRIIPFNIERSSNNGFHLNVRLSLSSIFGIAPSL